MRSIGYGLVALSIVVASGAAAQGYSGPGWGKAGRRGGEGQPQQGQGEKPPTKEEKKFPLGQAWIAVSLNGKVFGGNERPTFRLDDQFRVHGFGGCNTFSATAYPLREQGLAVGPIAMTKRSCDKGLMASEMQFLTALRTSAKWDTVIGTLVIKSQNGELRFERSL
jgi:heat shock protein HslJ